MRAWLLACSIVLALIGEARSLVVAGERGACTVTEDGLAVHVAWDLEVPVQVKGLNAIQTAKLRQMMYADAFGEALADDGQLQAAPSDALQEWIYQKMLDVARLRGVSTAGALDIAAYARMVFAGKKWLGYAYSGYLNQGGNGCHQRVALRVLSIPELEPMKLAEGIRPGQCDRFVAWLAERAGRANGLQEKPALPADPSLTDFMPYREGVAFRFRPYSVFCGAAGVVGVMVPWEELKPWFRESFWDMLRTLAEEEDK